MAHDCIYYIVNINMPEMYSVSCTLLFMSMNIYSFKLSYYNEYKSYLRECEAKKVINSLNYDGFDIGSRC